MWVSLTVSRPKSSEYVSYSVRLQVGDNESCFTICHMSGKDWIPDPESGSVTQRWPFHATPYIPNSLHILNHQLSIDWLVTKQINYRIMFLATACLVSVSLWHFSSAALPSLRSLERQVKDLDRASFAFPRCVCTIHTLENVSTAGVKLMSLAYRRYPSCNVEQDCKKKTADCPDFCREMGYKFLGKNASLATVFNDTSISIGSEMCMV